jgi:ribokinase
VKALNYGSLNIDFVYNVEHFVRSGETISSQNMAIFAGGKGLNQSVALAKSGIDTWHAGCIGEDGEFLADILQKSGAHTELISRLPGRNGHAIIQKQPNGQNCILLYGGSNQQNTRVQIDEVMSHFEKGDYLILQNEINEISYIMERAHEKGMIIVLNPSPMDEKIRTYPLEYVDYFLLNEIEAKDLTGFDQNLADTDQHRVQEMDEVSSAWDALLEEVCSHFPNSKVVLTLGEYGSIYKDEKQKIHQPIMKVPVVDTTAAGDTFTGFFIGSIAKGLSPENAMKIAAKASAIAVSRQGAAPSIPELGEVERDMTL